MSDTPKLIKYWGGRFRICKENLPESIKKNKELHNRVLLLVYNKFKNYPWGKTLPEQRFALVNDYAYSLLQEHF